jgi:hypothetical protein
LGYTSTATTTRASRTNATNWHNQPTNSRSPLWSFTFDLYWKGDLPEPLRSTVERVRERFTVVVHEAPYSWIEVAQEARRLLAEATTVEGLEGLVATAAEHDLSGIRVLVSELPLAPSSVRAELGSHMPVRLEVTKLGRPQLQPAGWRWDDLPPWTGGRS